MASRMLDLAGQAVEWTLLGYTEIARSRAFKAGAGASRCYGRLLLDHYRLGQYCYSVFIGAWLKAAVMLINALLEAALFVDMFIDTLPEAVFVFIDVFLKAAFMLIDALLKAAFFEVVFIDTLLRGNLHVH